MHAIAWFESDVMPDLVELDAAFPEDERGELLEKAIEMVLGSDENRAVDRAVGQSIDNEATVDEDISIATLDQRSMQLSPLSNGLQA